MKPITILILIIKILLSVTIAVELFNRCYFKKCVGIIALKRDNTTIQTSLSVIALIRYLLKSKETEFKKDCERFFDSLDDNAIYCTKTHGKIKRAIEKKCEKENILIAEIEKRRMILESLCIGNTKNILKKRRYFTIAFKTN